MGNSPTRSDSSVAFSEDRDEHYLLTQAVLELFEAYKDGKQLGSDRFSDMAVEVSELQRVTGATNTTLRRLVLDEFVEHVEEITRPAVDGRALRMVGGFKFVANSCFFLKSKGVAFAEQLENDGVVLTPSRAQREKATLKLLFDAYQQAQQLGRKLWDFAVEIGALKSAGATNAILRKLTLNGLVKHAVEFSNVGHDSRGFKESGNLTFSANTCFVLTEAGVPFARTAG